MYWQFYFINFYKVKVKYLNKEETIKNQQFFIRKVFMFLNILNYNFQ
jgi:hypothetical protein